MNRDSLNSGDQPVCVACGASKPTEEFYLRRAGGTQRINRCRDCDNARPRKRNTGKIVRIRARHRATAELIKRHDTEFRDLLEYFTATATEEAAQIAARAPEAAAVETPRLRPGRPRTGQDRTQRLDLARCPHCIRHHDKGHACTKCGAIPHAALHRTNDGVIDDVAIERRMAGQPVALTTLELEEAARQLAGRGMTQTEITRRLHMSGTRVAQALERRPA
jgi:hypothetical protein